MAETEDQTQADDNVTIELFGSDGEKKDEQAIHNLVVTVGKNGIADQLVASPAIGKPTHMAIGTGGGGPAAGDTALTTESDRNALTSKTRSTNVVTMVGDWAAGDGTGSITEAGIFDASSSGNLYARAVFTAIPKGASDTLRITWTITVSEVADFPLAEGQRWLTYGGTGASSTARGISPSTSANTKGSYTALWSTATNTMASSGLWLTMYSAAANTDYLLDVAVGGVGAEVVVAANLLYSGQGSFPTVNYLLPIALPTATRVTLRAQQSGTGAKTVSVSGQLLGTGFLPSTPLSPRVASYGPNTADSGAVSVDPGGSANTKGAWSEITSGTTFDHSAIIVAFGNQANAARTVGSFLVDIGIGGAGSEVAVLTDIPMTGFGDPSTGVVNLPTTPTLPLQIPAGTRLAARAQCDITDATDRLFDCAIYGI